MTSDRTTQRDMAAAFAHYLLAAEMRRLYGELLSPEDAATVALTMHRRDLAAWRARIKAEGDAYSEAAWEHAAELFAQEPV